MVLDSDNGETQACVRAASTQFCYKPKIALKIQTVFKNAYGQQVEKCKCMLTGNVIQYMGSCLNSIICSSFGTIKVFEIQICFSVNFFLECEYLLQILQQIRNIYRSGDVLILLKMFTFVFQIALRITKRTRYVTFIGSDSSIGIHSI